MKPDTMTSNFPQAEASAAALRIIPPTHAQQSQLEHRDTLHSGRRFYDDETKGALTELLGVCISMDAESPDDKCEEAEYRKAVRRAADALHIDLPAWLRKLWAET